MLFFETQCRTEPSSTKSQGQVQYHCMAAEGKTEHIETTTASARLSCRPVAVPISSCVVWRPVHSETSSRRSEAARRRQHERQLLENPRSRQLAEWKQTVVPVNLNFVNFMYWHSANCTEMNLRFPHFHVSYFHELHFWWCRNFISRIFSRPSWTFH